MKGYAIAYRMLSLFYLWMQSILKATKVTSGWIRKGVDKPIETTDGRTRMNIISAVRLNHLSGTVVNNYETVNGRAIMALWSKLSRRTYQSIGFI
jgi:hypothetical protein